MKKLMVCITAALMIGTAVIGVSAGSYVRGDADGDGHVDIVDTTVISRRIADIDVPSFFPKQADVDGSGAVEITDATLIQRMLAEIGNPYRIGETVDETEPPTEKPTQPPTEKPTQPPTDDPDELPFIPIR